MEDAFAVLADRTRRRILDELRRGDRVVGELVDQLGVAQPTVSKHLKVLRGAGLVTVRVEAQQRRYALAPDGLRPLDDWLEPYRRFWLNRFDDLGVHLDRTYQDKGEAG
ncbi:winged helix-turn-helix transcriptional regulator [Spiractinospora alimapuensis]|uniref:ArsR/SmtB family transcription factor n=1 Tax=Spiractinospora alimapuensis TaxID=2820884 RepID=UPI001F256B4D|nr:metalloregulator ArsR/SmtB family transcription factor [Spiractinospora alimapuensis]QVQ51126.1 winged helix-turn-helix transcriptional regulator [Spiractinospora alimapuensis]